MELLGYIAAIPLAAEGGGEESGNFLVSPGVGLMIWTLVLFLITLWVLKKFAFPKIQEALDKRAKVISESIESAERQRKESDELLAEYRASCEQLRQLVAPLDLDTPSRGTLSWREEPVTLRLESPNANR